MASKNAFSRIPFYPFVLAVMPAISVYANQPSQVMPIDLAAAVAVSLVGAAVVFGVAKLLLKDAPRSAFASLLVIFWIFSYGIGVFSNAVLDSLSLPMLPHRVWLLAAAVVMMAGLIWVYRRESLPENWTRGLNLFTCCTLATPAFILAAALIGGETAFRYLPPNDTPRLQEVALTLGEDSPDIYYLVFDRYARADVLQREYGFDNEPFLNELRTRGFVVADQSRANYPKTEYSMSSALNMSLHGSESAPKSHYMHWLAEHRVGKTLKANGYRYYHLGNMLDGLRSNPMADENFRFSRFDCEYHDVMVELTAFHPWLASMSHRDRALQKFERLPKIAAEKHERKFVYAHFLLPHEPWKFDRHGNDPANETASRTKRENYVEQLIYTNQRILETIDAIRQNSPRPPVIVLQADEGPELKYAGDEQRTLHEQVDRRTAILSAFSLPGRESAAISADVTPVNTFRIVFCEYFAADLPNEPDRAFYWSHPNILGKPAVTRINQMVDWTDRLKTPEVARHPVSPQP